MLSGTHKGFCRKKNLERNAVLLAPQPSFCLATKNKVGVRGWRLLWMRQDGQKMRARIAHTDHLWLVVSHWWYGGHSPSAGCADERDWRSRYLWQSHAIKPRGNTAAPAAAAAAAATAPASTTQIAFYWFVVIAMKTDRPPNGSGARCCIASAPASRRRERAVCARPAGSGFT